MPYIGNQPSESFTSFATQEFSTSATTSYTLDHAVTNENEIALFINNVRQQPGSGKAYTATGTALTLSAATASTDTMYCVFLGRALQTVTPATNSITAAMVSNDLISGKDALTSSPASTDEIILSDGGTLKRADISVIGNAPAFLVRLSGNQTLSHDTLTRITWDTEDYDTNSAFASNVFTVPSGEGGKYVFSYCVFGDDSDDTNTFSAYIEVDGTANQDSNSGLASPRSSQNMILRAVTIITLTAGQVVEVVAKHQGTNQNEVVRSSGSFFSGHKLIGV